MANFSESLSPNDRSNINTSAGTPSYLDNHKVGRVLIKHLGNVEQVLSIPAEADLTSEMKDRILAACTELQTMVIPDARVMFPTEWAKRSGGFSSDLAVNLGLIPNGISDAIMAHLQAIDRGERPTFQDLQSLDLDLNDIRHSLEKGSPLEWHSFALEMGGAAFRLDPREFITNVANFLKYSIDPTERNHLACNWLERMQREVFIIPELGNDIPVSFSEGNAIMDIEDGPPIVDSIAGCGFGFDISATYVKSAKCWILSDFKNIADGLEDSAKVRKNNTSGLVFYTAYQFSDLKEAIDYLRKEGRLNLPPIEYASVFHGKLPTDVSAQGRFHTFHGSFSTEPLILKSCVDEKFTKISFAIDKFNQSHALAWINVGTKNSYHVPFAGEIDRGSKLWPTLLKEFAKLKGANVRILSFTDRSKLMLLDKPVGPFKPHELKKMLVDSEAVSKKDKYIRIYGFQLVANGFEWVPLIHPVSIQTAHKRFKDRYVGLDFAKAESLPLSVAINRRPLTFAFDPILANLNFPSNDSGHNGLIDFWDCSIPLVKPSVSDFAQPELAGIRALSNVPANKWTDFLRAIEGDRLDKIELVQLLEKNSELRTETTESLNLPRQVEIREGECFKQPRSKISIFGSWIVSHCTLNDMKFFVVDSPLYGNALFLFRYLEGAEMAARHFESQGIRAQSRMFPGYIRKINHTQNWRVNLTNTVYNSILDIPTPADVRLIG